MTFNSYELAQRGVDPRVIEFRQWRRRVPLTEGEVARLLDVNTDTIRRVELGAIQHPHNRLVVRMRNLMLCWRESLRPTRDRPPLKRGRKPRTPSLAPPSAATKLKPLAKCDV